ncbi:MAG: hypothetical protein BWX95_00491 [Bacteroidetes bacterium ADurb.Bin141]|nr:MAG: hypothetical protein UZ10_BCD003001666 [Bacteroidetes bacterium OLB10]OQB64668.1 MAG: hypothetical protein BWX95_00491 [Bacteroidetes bacterium ADurb.Bin141]
MEVFFEIPKLIGSLINCKLYQLYQFYDHSFYKNTHLFNLMEFPTVK